MKKTITVILCAVLCVFSLSAVRTDDIDITLNASGNTMSLSGKTNEGSDFSPKFDIDIAAQFNMHFDGEHGFFTGLDYGTDLNRNRLTLKGGYAYKLYLNSDFDFVVEAGPTLSFGFRKGEPLTLGTVVNANFNYSLSKTVYLQFGLGWNVEFFDSAKIGSKTVTDAYFSSELVLPRLGFGFAF